MTRDRLSYFGTRFAAVVRVSGVSLPPVRTPRRKTHRTGVGGSRPSKEIKNLGIKIYEKLMRSRSWPSQRSAGSTRWHGNPHYETTSTPAKRGKKQCERQQPVREQNKPAITAPGAREPK